MFTFIKPIRCKQYKIAIMKIRIKTKIANAPQTLIISIEIVSKIHCDSRGRYRAVFYFISFLGLSRMKLAWVTLKCVFAWLKITSPTYQALKRPNMILLRGDQNTCNQSSVNNIISVSAEGRSQRRIIIGYLCSQWLEELWSGMYHLLIFMNKLFLHALKTLLMREFIFFLLFLKLCQSVCMREWEIVKCVCVCVCVYVCV